MKKQAREGAQMKGRLRFSAIVVAASLCGAAVANADCTDQDYIEAFRAGELAFAKQAYSDSIKWWRPLAEQGLGLAQAKLGRLYANGQGIAADPVAAYQWTSLAIQAGSASPA